MGFLSENDFCDTADAAKMVGVSVRTFQGLGLSPVHTEAAAKFYSADDVLELRDERKLAKAQKDWQNAQPAFDDNGEAIDVNAERARKLQAERIGQEIKNKQATGELIETRYARAAVVTIQGAMNAVLESIPARVKRIMPTITGAALDDIERECANGRNSIADFRLDWAEVMHLADSREDN